MNQSTDMGPVFVTPLRRPERKPKKSSPRHVKARPMVIHVALGIVAATMVMAFAGRIAAFAMEPVVAIHRTGTEIQQLRAELKREIAHNEQLKQDIGYLKTKSGLEQEARRRGWVQSGEVALSVVVPETEMEAATPVAENNSPETGQPSIAERIRRAVDTCFAVFGASSPSR